VVLLLGGFGIYAGYISSLAKEITVTDIKVNSAEHIDVNSTMDITYELVFDMPKKASERASRAALKKKKNSLEIEASSFSPNVLKVENVSEQGKDILRITGLNNGSAKYYIKCDDISKTFEIVSGVLAPESITAEESIFLSRGERVNVNAIVGPKYAEDTVTYEVEDDFVAQVDAAGYVSFISTGVTYVKSVTSNGIETRTKVVAAIVAEKIQFDNHYLTCSVGTVFNPGYAISPSYVTYGSDILIYSSNENVVRYDSSKGGFVTVAAGEADVIIRFASKEELKDSLHVKVMGSTPVTDVKESASAKTVLEPVINEGILCKRAGMTKLSVKNILQNPQLRNGCEITSATIALNYLGYSVDKVTMADKYLNCEKPYDKVDPNEAYMGDPHATGWYCYAPVIVEAVNEYFEDNGYKEHMAVDITGCSFEDMKELVDEGTPVVFWGTLYFNQPYHSQKFTLPDGSLPYSNLHCLVMTGYDNDYVYISDPLGLGSKVARDKFVNIFEEMGSRAVKIIEK